MTTQHRKWQQCQSTSSQPNLVLCNCPDWVKLLGRLRHYLLANRGYVYNTLILSKVRNKTFSFHLFRSSLPRRPIGIAAKISFEEPRLGSSTMTFAPGLSTQLHFPNRTNFVRQKTGVPKRYALTQILQILAKQTQPLTFLLPKAFSSPNQKLTSESAHAFC